MGTAVLDFGAFPGASDATFVLTGQAGIGANDTVQAWIQPQLVSADHSSDEALANPPRIYAGNIVPGVGFTIYGTNDDQVDGIEGAPGIANNGSAGPGRFSANVGNNRTYGKWNVAWTWANTTLTFAPTSLPSLLAWYKADAGVFSDAGVTPAVDGATVQQWNDQSGNGLNLSQATAGNRPTFNTGSFNALKGITFTPAATSWLSNAGAAFVGLRQFSVWMAMNLIAPGGANGVRYITYSGAVANQDFNNLNDFIFIIQGGVATQFDSYSPPTTGFSTGRSPTTWTTGAPGHVIGTNLSGPGQAINTAYIDGVAGTPVPLIGGSPTLGNAGSGFIVGAQPGGGAGTYANMVAAEIIVTSTALSPNDIANIQTYLKGRWGTT